MRAMLFGTYNASVHPRIATIGEGLRDIDAAALRSADITVVDTQEHLEALPQRFQDRAVVVPVGAPAEWFRAALPADGEQATDSEPLRVIFYGLFTPLHGTPVIGEALGLLAGDPGIEVTMVGTGQEYATTRAAAAANERVRWTDWVAPGELPSLVARHDVCLGIFGTGDKARRVIPNKVYQGAAAACAIVTSDTPPQRRVLTDVAVLVPPGDAKALANALRDVAADPCEYRRRARELAERRFTSRSVVTPLVETFTRLLPAGR